MHFQNRSPCRLMKPLSWPSLWLSETDHPSYSSAFMVQTGSACLRGWPSPKPEVYTASGSVQIKTVIIDLGLDSALYEKVGEAGGVSDVISGLEPHSLGLQRWCWLTGWERTKQREKKDGMSACTLNRSKWNWLGLLSGWLWVYIWLCETLSVGCHIITEL